MIGSIGVPVALGAAAIIGLPRWLRTKFTPPQRDQPHVPEDVGLDAEEIWLTAVDGASLRAWHIPQPKPAPLLVVIHGWGGNASLMLPVGPILFDAGYSLLMLDARNHGGSDHTDHMSMPRFAQDIDVALDWAAALPDSLSLGLLGHSIGAGASILVASRRTNLAAVVAVGAFSHPWELMREAPAIARMPRVAQWAILRSMERVVGQTMDDIAPRTRIQQATCPIMLVHGGRDQVISHRDFDELSRLSPPGSEALLVPDAVHDRLDEYAPHLSHVLGFLAKHLRRSSASAAAPKVVEP